MDSCKNFMFTNFEWKFPSQLTITPPFSLLFGLYKFSYGWLLYTGTNFLVTTSSPFFDLNGNMPY